MYVLDCAEVVSRNIGTKYLQTRFVRVHAFAPESVEVARTDVFFRFCKLYFDFDYHEAGVDLASECGRGYLLWDNERKELVLPAKIEFIPEVYFPRARIVSLEEAKAGKETRDQIAQHWMEAHDVTGAIRASDGRYHRITSDIVVLEQAVPA